MNLFIHVQMCMSRIPLRVYLGLHFVALFTVSIRSGVAITRSLHCARTQYDKKSQKTDDILKETTKFAQLSNHY